ncbi:MAG: CHAT domain-containing protein [Chitinophagaceae bacterium]|nr:CHAT domain-containing protein [Chitinophagaceae bacterium]
MKGHHKYLLSALASTCIRKARPSWISTLYLSIVFTTLCSGGALAQDDYSMALSYQDSAKHYERLNKNLQAYNYSKKAIGLLKSNVSSHQDKIARIESDMGTYAYRMGNIDLSKIHHRRALELARSLQPPNYECLYLSYNNMGGIMWFASKMDSAQYYYTMALDAIAHMDSTPLNKYYRPAVLNNNLAGIYGVQGKTTEGIAAMKATIQNLRAFLAIEDSTLNKDNAMHFQFEATDNLAGIYKELGDYRKAAELLQHSYQEKQKAFGADDPDISKSEALIGQLYYAMKDYARAERYLLKSLKGFDQADGDFLFWQADAYSALALIYEGFEKKEQAAICFEKADSLYEKSLNGEYDNIYMQFLNNASVFYARNNAPSIALKKAMKGYAYIASTEGEQSLSGFYQLLNLSDVYFELKDYNKALSYGRQALKTVNRMISGNKVMLDSVKIELKKPKAILLTSRCEYELLKKKSPEALAAILDQLREAFLILERRRSVLQDIADVNILISDHKDLLDFVKKIVLELYVITQDPVYIDELTGFHESGLYNRIRARLDQETNIQFAGIPANVRDTEKQLKARLISTLEGDHDSRMQRYIRAEEDWQQFLETLRTSYPEYYKMRYASIFRSPEISMKQIPEGSSVVRFMFAGKELAALVADKEQRQLIVLDTDGLNAEVEALSAYNTSPEKLGDALYRLYNRLWRPIAKSIRNKRVIIIPDGILFNINFEMLSPVRIKRFEELSVNSLLAEYVISYNYSLFLVNKNRHSRLNGNFIAFTPGFSDRSKEAYKNSSDTAMLIDNFYLTLLPQPFSVDLAATAVSQFGGDIYTGERSTVNAFRQKANGHAIIHIGTHAEADNLNPQLSRLIFSKGVSQEEMDNYLYLFDIYNCDLDSKLTVLTACETGKVGYEDGEGLVSLAHAFNYAGSESILMGLWKIDEKSCATLVKYFYENLSRGRSKDEALKEAKMAYLRETRGRALAPQYWAGLVIMGNTDSIHIEKRNYTYWLTGAFLLLGGVVFWLARKRAKSRQAA